MGRPFRVIPRRTPHLAEIQPPAPRPECTSHPRTTHCRGYAGGISIRHQLRIVLGGCPRNGIIASTEWVAVHRSPTEWAHCRFRIESTRLQTPNPLLGVGPAHPAPYRPRCHPLPLTWIPNIGSSNREIPICGLFPPRRLAHHHHQTRLSPGIRRRCGHLTTSCAPMRYPTFVMWPCALPRKNAERKSSYGSRRKNPLFRLFGATRRSP